MEIIELPRRRTLSKILLVLVKYNQENVPVPLPRLNVSSDMLEYKYNTPHGGKLKLPTLT